MSKRDEISLGDMVDNWGRFDDVDDDDFFGDDWRQTVREKIKTRDTRELRRSVLPEVQAEIIRIALEGKNEQTRLSAGQYLLAQEGEGAVTKVEGRMTFESMGEGELQALISSKIERLKELRPDFDVGKLIPQYVDGEVVYSVNGNNDGGNTGAEGISGNSENT